jgi:hypothetical protein
MPSKEEREAKGTSGSSVDSGGAERDWKLYRKQKSKLIISTLQPITCTISDLCGSCRLDFSSVTRFNPALSHNQLIFNGQFPRAL